MAAPVADVQRLLERSLKDLHAPSDLAQRVIARGERARRRRRISTGVGAVVLTAAAVVAAWATLDTSPEARPATVVPATPEPASGELIPEAQRKPAPELAGTTIEGKQYTAGFLKQPLARQPDQITVVNFCGSWSAPCRAEAPALLPPPHLGNAADSDVTHYVVVDERDSVANARAFARRLGIDGPVVFDGTGALGRAWNSDVPVTFVVDGDGLIAARFDGAITQLQLTRVVDELHIEQGGGTFSNQEFIAGVHNVTSIGRRLTIAWANDRCGDTVQAVLAQVRVRENVRAVHVEVLGRISAAVASGREPNALTGCADGAGFDSTATVTLDAPLGNRAVLDGTSGAPLDVLRIAPARS